MITGIPSGRSLPLALGIYTRRAGLRLPEGVIGEDIDHSSSGCWCFEDQLIHSRRVSCP